jgi:dTDP-4-amino-4,6-dideoxygalactose transaminase
VSSAKGITTVDDLAIFGAAPLFPETLHVGRPNTGNRQRLLARINQALDSRWLTNNGPMVRAFEERLADYLGVRHCVAVCNGTLALEIAIRSLNLTGEVIVPSFTFVATAHALQWQQITPVFADIDPVTCTLSPESVERMITARTTGIVGVHVWGRPCAVNALQVIADRHGLKLMFDAAHALGCSHDGRMIGNFGECEILSFHATKFFNTFEGGAIVTNNDALAEKCRLARNFGFQGADNVVCLGTNGKMHEVSAAMGLTGLESMEDVIATNRANYERYARRLGNLPGVRLMRHDTAERTNYQYVVIEVLPESGLERDALLQILRAENVLARRYFYPGCHGMEPYRSLFPDAADSLPHTVQLSERVLSLPTGTAVGDAEIDSIGELLSFIVSHKDQIQTRWRNAVPSQCGSS